LLEQVARDHGVPALKLETGPLQPAALAFYERNGFTRITAFGDYPEGEYSIFYGKQLAAR
jgi:putative acetyltransferase